MLSDGAKIRFYQMIRFGCFLKVVPFNWDRKNRQLLPASALGLGIFHMYEIAIYSHTVTGFLKVLIHRNSGKELPLMEKLLSIIWIFAFTITSAAVLQLRLRRKDIMLYANRIFGILRQSSSGKPSKKLSQEAAIELKTRSNITLHMYIGLFLLFSNPSVHILIIAAAPCTPFYLSSSYLKCESFGTELITLMEKAPFLAFESWAISMFLYLCSFYWSLIFLGLGEVEMELHKLKENMVTKLNYRRVGPILRDYRKFQVLIAVINDNFRFFLMTFPIVLLSICALLMYGTIRLWNVDPLSNLMYPLCGVRCGFEALTPLAMAGNVNKASALVLDKWRKMREQLTGVGGRRYEMRVVKLVQKSCAKLQCTSGSMYTFENSIVLCIISNCLQLTLNLLVSFHK